MLLGNTPDEKWHTIDNIICTEEKLDYTDYMRTYNDNAAIIESDVPQEAINEIFNKMNKITEEERRINCTSCGYKNCHEMAQAIYHGYNSPQNCVHFVKDALIENNEKLESVLTAVLGNEGDLGILGVSLVSSEQIVQRIKDAMIEVENQREELNNNINAKTQMFANLTHELRTPLNAIVNMTDLLDKNNLTKKQLENINSIKIASSELMDTVNEILDFSKIEFGELSIVEDEYFLHDLFSEVITVMSFRCLEKKLQFIRRIDPSTPDLVVGDFKRTRQVFINLISNAVKYTNLGSVTVELGWNHDEENPELGFSVTDTGMGIKQEDIPYLFDSYKQVNEKESKHIQGTGLGLAISKDIVTAMGGTIEVESEYGVGTKFVVRLPAKYSKYVPVSEINMDKVEQSRAFAKKHKKEQAEGFRLL